MSPKKPYDYCDDAKNFFSQIALGKVDSAEGKYRNV
jgi:hypothetical protein